MKISAINMAVRLQMAITARFGSSVANTLANNGTIKHTKTYKKIPDQRSSLP
jgi:hypothetical protein